MSEKERGSRKAPLDGTTIFIKISKEWHDKMHGLSWEECNSYDCELARKMEKLKNEG